MHDTRLIWTDGKQPAGPFVDPEVPPAESDLDFTPDKGFIDALRGGEPVISPPSTVWPVLNFTLAALDSARSGAAVSVNQDHRL